VLTGIGLNLDNGQPTTCINDVLAAQLRSAGQVRSGWRRPGWPATAAGARQAVRPLRAASWPRPPTPPPPRPSAAPPRQGAAGAQVGREALLAHILNELERCFDTFAGEGFAPLQEAYLSHWMHGRARQSRLRH
jgi:biotin--protein ligase